MAGQLLKLALLLISLTCSSSVDPTVTAIIEIETDTSENLPNVTNNVPLFGALNDNTPSDKVIKTENTTEELMTSRASTNEPKVSPEQETSPTGAISQEDASTVPVHVMTIRLATSKDPAPATFTPGSLNDHFTQPTNVSVISDEDDETNDRGMTSSTHPSGETAGISEPVATQAPKNISSTTTKPKESEPTLEELSNKKKTQTIILVVVLAVILLLILVTVVVIIVRGKRRRGSQSFQSQSRSSKRQDVWAGQVPELGDGKMTQHPMGMENGMTGNKPEPAKEQEMMTFISAEKKDDSVVEMNELGKGDVSEEKKPLLEDSSQVNEEPEKPPVEEQTPAPTVEQELV